MCFISLLIQRVLPLGASHLVPLRTNSWLWTQRSLLTRLMGCHRQPGSDTCRMNVLPLEHLISFPYSGDISEGSQVGGMSLNSLLHLPTCSAREGKQGKRTSRAKGLMGQFPCFRRRKMKKYYRVGFPPFLRNHSDIEPFVLIK